MGSVLIRSVDVPFRAANAGLKPAATMKTEHYQKMQNEVNNPFRINELPSQGSVRK